MGEIVTKRAGDRVDAVWRHGRRHDTFARAVGTMLYANVVDGVLVCFGVEPVVEPIIPAPPPPHRRAVLVWAGPIAGAAAAAGAVATGWVLRHRRAA